MKKLWLNQIIKIKMSLFILLLEIYFLYCLNIHILCFWKIILAFSLYSTMNGYYLLFLGFKITWDY